MNTAESHANRAYDLFSQEQYEQALADCNKAIQLDSDFAYAYGAKAVVYYEQGELEQAIEELDKAINSVMERQETLELQISDVDSRLEHLYDALEKGSFRSDELAPRIRKLQERKNGLLEKKCEIAMEAQPNFLEMPDLKVIQGYVEDLSSLLASSSIIEKRGFLKSFVSEIIVDDETVIINYKLPMPPENSEEEKFGVLPFIRHGRPCRIKGRTFSASFALII